MKRLVLFLWNAIRRLCKLLIRVLEIVIRVVLPFFEVVLRLVFEIVLRVLIWIITTLGIPAVIRIFRRGAPVILRMFGFRRAQSQASTVVVGSEGGAGNVSDSSEGRAEFRTPEIRSQLRFRKDARESAHWAAISSRIAFIVGAAGGDVNCPDPMAALETLWPQAASSEERVEELRLAYYAAITGCEIAASYTFVSFSTLNNLPRPAGTAPKSRKDLEGQLSAGLRLHLIDAGPGVHAQAPLPIPAGRQEVSPVPPSPRQHLEPQLQQPPSPRPQPMADIVVALPPPLPRPPAAAPPAPAPPAPAPQNPQVAPPAPVMQARVDDDQARFREFVHDSFDKLSAAAAQSDERIARLADSVAVLVEHATAANSRFVELGERLAALEARQAALLAAPVPPPAAAATAPPAPPTATPAPAAGAAVQGSEWDLTEVAPYPTPVLTTAECASGIQLQAAHPSVGYNKYRYPVRFPRNLPPEGVITRPALWVFYRTPSDTTFEEAVKIALKPLLPKTISSKLSFAIRDIGCILLAAYNGHAMSVQSELQILTLVANLVTEVAGVKTETQVNQTRASFLESIGDTRKAAAVTALIKGKDKTTTSAGNEVGVSH